MDHDNEDVYKKPVKRWPLPRVVRPRIKALVKSTVTEIYEIPPLDPKIIQESEEYTRQLAEATQVLHNLESEYTKLCEELEGLEKGNRWSNRSGKEPRIQFLKKEIISLKTKKDAAKEVHNKILKDSVSLMSFITCHESLLESYERLKKLESVIKNETGLEV